MGKIKLEKLSIVFLMVGIVLGLVIGQIYFNEPSEKDRIPPQLKFITIPPASCTANAVTMVGADNLGICITEKLTTSERWCSCSIMRYK